MKDQSHKRRTTDLVFGVAIIILAGVTTLLAHIVISGDEFSLPWSTASSQVFAPEDMKLSN